MAIREQFTVDASQYRAELGRVERETEQSARKMGRAWKGTSQSMKSQEGSINDLRNRIDALTNARDKFANPKTIERYNRRIQELTKEKKKLENQTVETGSKMQGMFKKIGMAAKIFITGMAVSAFLALKKAIGLAQTVEETASKFDTVLGPAVASANKFIEENARLMGLSDTQAKEMVATTAAIAQGMGFVGEDAANLSTRIVKLAGDLQSFNDVPIERTHNAITTALTGEREALKTLGIVVREAEVQQRAMANTGLKNAEALNQQQKAAATFQLITERAGVAIGDLERTQDSVANKSRRLGAEFRDLVDRGSSKLLNSLDDVVTLGLDTVRTFEKIVSASPVEEIEAEQRTFNLLASEISDTNEESDARIVLAREMNRLYPDLLENLDLEKIGNEDLAAAVREANKEFEDRILIQGALTQLVEQQAVKTNALANLEEKQGQIRSAAYDLFNENRTALDKYGLSIDLVNSSTEEQAQFIRDANEALENNSKASRRSRSAINEYEAAVRQYNVAQDVANQADSIFNETLAETERRLLSVGFSQERVNEILSDYKDGLKEIEDEVVSGGATSEQLKKAAEDEEERIRKFLQGIEDAALVAGDFIGGFHGMIFKDAASATEEYNNTLTRLNNELESGIITQQEYEAQVNKASDVYLRSLSEIYKMIKDQLTPDQQKMFKSWFDGIKKFTK